MIRQNSITIALDLARMSKYTEALSLLADLCIASFVRMRSIIILVGAFLLTPLFWPRKQLRWYRRPPGLKGRFLFIACYY